MSEPLHRDLAGGRWWTLSLPEQLGNIGIEIEQVAGAFRTFPRQRARGEVPAADGTRLLAFPRPVATSRIPLRA